MAYMLGNNLHRRLYVREVVPWPARKTKPEPAHPNRRHCYWSRGLECIGVDDVVLYIFIPGTYDGRLD